MITSWNNLLGLVQGDISYNLRVFDIQDGYVDFLITAFSERWSEFDASFEYKLDLEFKWKDDMAVVSDNSKQVEKNKLYGLSASKYGSANIIRWYFEYNRVFIGQNVHVRVNILPRIRSFSTSGRHHLVTETNNANMIKANGSSNEEIVIGVNQSGQHICKSSDYICIRDIPNGDVIYTSKQDPIIYSLNDPQFAMQKLDGNYIIADTGNNRVIEVFSNLSSIIKELSVSSPVFIDIFEKTNSILITRRTDDLIEEYTWDSDNYGVKIWGSDETSLVLSSPESATYKENDLQSIIISDTGNNKVVLYNKTDDSSQEITSISLSDETPTSIVANVTAPFRSYWKGDKINDICIIEKTGKPITL